MPKFSRRSLDRLETCHRDLQRLFKEVVKGFDCSILCGERGEEDQTRAFKDGLTKVEYPFSKHNKRPSDAVDVAPYPIDWNDLNRFYLFCGYVKRTAEELGIEVRGGYDWDGDTEVLDQTFNDLPHWELV